MISKAECLGRFDGALSLLRKHFPELEDSLPRPNFMRRTQGIVLRYDDQLIEHAILMKLARSISILGAMRLLVDGGFIQEQGVLQRAADETDEDLLFLAFGKQNGLKRIHKDYLKAFWREEFEGSGSPSSYRIRHMVRRKEIRDYLSAHTGEAEKLRGPVERFIYGVFSGFVHGASTQIYELLDPHTRSYRIAGTVDDDDRQGYFHNAANYPYRALMTGVIAARALGVEAIADVWLAAVREYEDWLSIQVKAAGVKPPDQE
jgi:hypothetical protein